MQKTVNDIVITLDASIWPAVSVFLLLLAAILYLEVKNEITYLQHSKIDNAILRYQLDCISKQTRPLVDYIDAEKYTCTLYRLWDWGYTRILPKEKFELIKPFIKEEKK
jgi:hypothetical protein